MANIYNNFGKIADAIRPACAKVVKKVAFDIQAHAQANAPVDTGFLRNSIYTVTSEGSTYQGGAKALPEIPHPPDELTAYAAVGAEYGAYVEYGTRYMAGQPFWEPAVESVRPGFDAAMSAIKDAMEGAAR